MSVEDALKMIISLGVVNRLDSVIDKIIDMSKNRTTCVKTSIIQILVNRYLYRDGSIEEEIVAE